MDIFITYDDVVANIPEALPLLETKRLKSKSERVLNTPLSEFKFRISCCKMFGIENFGDIKPDESGWVPPKPMFGNVVADIHATAHRGVNYYTGPLSYNAFIKSKIVEAGWA